MLRYKRKENLAEHLISEQEQASLHDWLLPLLLNGQLKVGEAKEYVQVGAVGMAAEPKSKN